MATSIIEISKLAGVSKSTVSRVLNEDPRVSPQAVHAVRAAAEQLGYRKPTSNVGRPRRTASGVRKGSILLLFPDTDPSALRTILSGQLLHGIEQVVRKQGMSLMVSGLPSPGKVPPSIEQRQVDGVLIRGFGNDARNGPAVIEGVGTLPAVHIFEPRSNFPPTWDVVLEDNGAIGRIAARYLLTRGRRRIGVLSALPNHPSMRHRVRSFRDAVEDAGVSLKNVIAANTDPVKMVDELLAEGPLDGLFVPGNFTYPGRDDIVVEAYRTLAARGTQPCRDLDLVSCNNDVSRLLTLDPRLPNIDIQAEAIGRAAAEMLLSRLRNPAEPQRRLAVSPALVETPAGHGAASPETLTRLPG